MSLKRRSFAPMTTSDDNLKAPARRAEYPGMFAHMLLGPDLRTPEERLEAERKEHARRNGRRAKDWWLKTKQE